MSVISVLIHDTYVYLYFPIVFALLLYRAAIAKEKNCAVILAVTSLLVFPLTIYLSFFSTITHPSGIHEIVLRMGRIALFESIDYGSNSSSLSFLKAAYLHDTGEYPMGIKRLWPLFISYVIVGIPLASLLFMFFRRLVKLCAKPFEKIIFALIGIMPAITTIPLFIIHTDYNRYVIGMGVYYFFLLIALVFMDEKIRAVFNGGMRKITEKPVRVLFLTAYVFIMGIDTGWGSSYFVDKLASAIPLIKQVISVF
jgi:hypothetical protein